MNVFDYFFENSKNFEKNFVLGSKGAISFKKLYNDSLKVALYLNDSIGKNKNVILISQNSIFFVTAYLGILKSGNICVPLDVSIEQENLSFISNLTECNVVFIENNFHNNFKFDKEIVLINESLLNKVIQNQNIKILRSRVEENDVAEIIFTSGSTGVPKGVMITHLNIISNTNSIIEYLKLTSNDIIGIVLPFFYCFGLSLLHTHLRVGGSVVLNNTFIFLGTLIGDLKKYKCTGFAGVPSHYQILLKKSKSFKTTEFPYLRYVTQAGGKLHDVFIEEFVEAFPKIDFFVMYGQTEATARLSYLNPDLVKKKLGSIGKAIPQVLLKIVDENGNEVDQNCEGELIAKGKNIMLGYYKDIEDTNNTVKNGWLYTGDLASIDKDGFIFLVGRKKEIIKIGGKRVSPRQIEKVILTLPNIIDCTINGVYDEILGEAIKATVVTDGSCDLVELKEKIFIKCKEKLSLYKIPQTIEFNSVMSVNSAGKKQYTS